MINEQAGTIAAISTPYGTGGIGIIRVSGSEAFEILKRTFESSRSFDEIRSHYAVHGRIVDPDSKQVLDDVLLIKMKGPHSFTGEDVVEINCHGGIVVLKNVLSLLLKNGARTAGPGEFTKRAFLNGKMDLAQAEAVIDLINAKTDEGSRAAASQLEGKLSVDIRNVRKKLIELIAHIEAVVDYPEHDIEDVTGDEIYKGVCSALRELDKIASSYDRGRLLREGITAAIIGRPNAGKSSLLNTLTGTNRAIVTDIPGTTRDIIEEYVNIKGIPVRFLDTAGIRETKDPVEAIGVERARSAASQADLVIDVIDVMEQISPFDIEILNSLKDKKKIIIISKTDKADEAAIDKARRQIAEITDEPALAASMLDGTGIDELKEQIEALFLKGEIYASNEVLVTNARHKQLLDMAIETLNSALEAHKAGVPLDFVTIDIKESAEYLGQVTGESVSEDVVREIFSRFCIGK